MGRLVPLSIDDDYTPRIEGQPRGNFTPLSFDAEPVKAEATLKVPHDVSPEPEPSFMKDVVGKTLTDVGKQGLGTVETALSTASGMMLWPFSKAYGLLKLPFGEKAARMAEEQITSLGYQPYTKEGKAAMGLVGKGMETFLKPTHMASEEVKKYSPEAAYLIELGGELAQFALAGSIPKGARALKPKAPWEKPVTEAAPLDTAFAKDQIQTRRAQQKAAGKPLGTLRRREVDVAEGARLEQRGEQARKAFEEVPKAEDILRRRVKEHEKPPTEITVAREPTPTERLEAIAKGKEAPTPELFLKKAQERVGGKYGIKEKPVFIEVDTNTGEYGVKIQDRNLPVDMKKKAQDIVDRAKVEGKSAEDAAKVLAQEWYGVESRVGGELLRARLRAEETVEGFESRPTVPEPEPRPKSFLETATERVGGRVGPPPGARFKGARIETITGKAKRIAKDVNTLLGKKGEIGDLGSLTPEQKAAYVRLSGELGKLKANAKKTGKTLEQYLIDFKVDPKTAAMLARKSEDLKKYAGSINLEKQKIPEELKQFETDIQNPKRVQTWDETGELSKEILRDYKEGARVLKKAKYREGLVTEEYDAIRQINVNAISRLKDIAETSTPEKFAEQYGKYKTDVFDALSNASSEAGRALNIHKKEVSITRMANAFSKLKRNLNERELKEFKELNLENPVEVKRFADGLGDPKVSDYFLEYWYNAILSGPPTHVVNIVGNTGWLAFQVPHRGIHAAVDLPYAKLTGKQRTAYMNEIFPMLAGYKTGFKRGKARAGDMIRTGKIQEFESKWAQEMQYSLGAWEKSPNPTMRKLAKYINPPTKALRAMDVWNNSIAFDGHVRALARRASNEKGLKGKAREAFEKDFIENPSDATLESAMEQAKYSTFMDDPDPATAIIINARNLPVVGPALRFSVLPFVNTISNLMKRGLEMTPGVGLLKEGVSRGMRKKTGKPFHPTPEVLAKQIEGAVLAYYVWQKAASGDIAGDLPKSKNERQQWYRVKKKPWSIRFGGETDPKTGEKTGGTWLSYRRIEPFNTVVAAAAVAYDKVKNNPDDEKLHAEIFLELADAMKNNIIDGSYFQGMQTLLNRHQSSKRLVSTVARFGASWIPYSSFFRSMVRVSEVLTDGKVTVKKGNEWMKAFSTTIPGLAKIAKVPKKLDVWGEESVIPGGVLQQWLPYKWSAEKLDIVEKELERLDIYPGLPSQTVKIDGEKVELDEDIYTKYCVDLGAKMKKKIKNIVSRPTYQAAAKRGSDREREGTKKRHRKRIESATDSIRHSALERAKKEQKKRIGKEQIKRLKGK